MHAHRKQQLTVFSAKGFEKLVAAHTNDWHDAHSGESDCALLAALLAALQHLHVLSHIDMHRSTVRTIEPTDWIPNHHLGVGAADGALNQAVDFTDSLFARRAWYIAQHGRRQEQEDFQGQEGWQEEGVSALATVLQF